MAPWWALRFSWIPPGGKYSWLICHQQVVHTKLTILQHTMGNAAIGILCCIKEVKTHIPYLIHAKTQCYSYAVSHQRRKPETPSPKTDPEPKWMKWYPQSFYLPPTSFLTYIFARTPQPSQWDHLSGQVYANNTQEIETNRKGSKGKQATGNQQVQINNSKRGRKGKENWN